MAAPASAAPLVAVTDKVSQQPQQLYMSTNNLRATLNESLFYSADGHMMFRLENKVGLLFDSKTLFDGQGNVLLSCKKQPLSLAKWTIVSGRDGAVLAKTRTVPGLAKYGVEVYVPSRSSSKPTFLVTPDMSLRHVIVRQLNSGGRSTSQEDRLVCDAAFGPSVVMGWMSALAQNWSYLLALEPGADAALVAAVLVIFTDLLQWEAVEGFMGMGPL